MEEKMNKEKMTDEEITEEIEKLTKEFNKHLYVVSVGHTAIATLVIAIEKICEILHKNKLLKEKFSSYEEKKCLELLVEYENLLNHLDLIVRKEVGEILELKITAFGQLDKVGKTIEKFKEKVKKVQEESLNIDRFRKYNKYPELVKEINLKIEKAFEAVEYVLEATKIFAIRLDEDN